jgi:hypothetical protein
MAKRGRPTSYDPVILPAVKAAAFFGATIEEIAAYLEVHQSTFHRWMIAEPELAKAVNQNRDQADARVVQSLYREAIKGYIAAICFWLKNRRPSEWRDVHNVDASVGHYILSDHPLSEDEWIEQRTRLIEAKPQGDIEGDTNTRY